MMMPLSDYRRIAQRSIWSRRGLYASAVEALQGYCACDRGAATLGAVIDIGGCEGWLRVVRGKAVVDTSQQDSALERCLAT